VNKASRLFYHFALCAFVLGLVSHDLCADELDEVRTILTTSQGTVAKWTKSPVVLVVHEGEFDFEALSQTTRFLDDHTGLEMIERIKSVDVSHIPDGLFGKAYFRIVKDETATESGNSMIVLPNGDVEQADIFILSLSPPDLLFLALIAGVQRKDIKLAVGQAIGGNCYFLQIRWISPSRKREFVQVSFS
jgi:hypothetical protein